MLNHSELTMWNRARRSSVNAAICAVLMTAACSKDAQPGPDFEAGYGVAHVYALQSGYAAGSFIQFAVQNVGPTDLTYGACANYVERRVGNAWVATDFHTDQPCPGILYLVMSGKVGEGSVTLSVPPGVSAGSYRIRIDDFGIWGTSDKHIGGIYSDSFSIVAR